jgi:hypothetical protein
MIRSNMNSPFPGMDPYIEACGLWEDFRDTLITDIKRVLSVKVPDKYVVRSGERNYFVLTSWDEDAQTREFMTQTDVGISAKLPHSQEEKESVALAEPSTELGPITMRSLVESEFRESFVEIRDTSEHRKLITTIEILSPSNKRRNSQG